MSFAGFPLPPSPGPGPTPSPNTHNLLSTTHGDTVPATPGVGNIIISATGAWKSVAPGSELDHLVIVAGIPTWSAQAGSGLGDVTGPGSSVDNSIARFDGTSGKMIQNSQVLIDDAGNVSINGNTLVSGDLTVLGNITGLDLAASGFVVGPASSTNDAIALYDGVTGELIKDSTITATAGGSGLVLPGDLTVNGDTTLTDVFATNLNVSNNTTISGNLTVLGDTTVQDLGLTGTVGDILYASGTDAFGNLGIGSDGEILTVVGGLPAWAVASGGAGAGGVVPTTLETTATITITDSDFLVALSGTTTVNLPATPSDGQRHIIKDSLGTAGSVNITINGNGSPIDNISSTSLINNYEAKTVIYMGALGQWQLV